MEKAEGIVWDLSDLYAGEDDPQIDKDIEAAVASAETFKDKYYEKTSAEDCTAERLLQALQDYEDLLEKGYRPYAMANLLFTANGKSDKYKAMVAKVQDTLTRLSNKTLFFSLEIQKIPDARMASFLATGKLDPYRHHIEALRLFTPYMLSEKEEQLINRKNLSGKTAFVNLFDEFTAAFEWELEIDGEMRKLTQSELRELQRNQDAALRRKAKVAHDGKYGENALIFTNIFGNIIKDHATEMELRGYDSPIQPTHLTNKTPTEVVETMIAVTTAHNHLAQEYCRLKAKMLGLPKLRGSDLYAPVVKSRRVVPFEQGKEMVLESFGSFSPEFGTIIKRAFEENWIDAEIRRGKRGGAFCYSIAPSLHPYVLMNYVDNLDSVYTLAHEFGHALHTVLSSERESILTFHPPLILAETASVFAEMLLTRNLLAQERERDSRIQIIASKLEDFFGTISRQTMYTLFEQDAHLEGAKRRLSADDFCMLWLRRRDEMYGDAVDFLEEEKWFWSVIPHFIHSRFYCYAYTFGALFVLALFNRYEEEGQAFVPKYRALLAAGDSDWPEKHVQKMGLDFTQGSFWEGGFRVIESLLEELKTLVK
ncbi:MAG: M3 family oligoendopeptidase [bacterium]